MRRRGGPLTLLYFGRSARQLFGAYHAPAAGAGAGQAVLVCPPWGQEYIASHRLLRVLAERLTARGHHVLRFDYYGTGDSGGAREDGDLAGWLDDAAAAADELRDMSGVAAVTAFGVRLGGAVAWRLAAERPDVRAAVLWDPVVDGADFVREMEAAQRDHNRWALTPRRARPPGDPTVDLLGFPLTPAMRASVETVRAADYGRPTAARVTLFHSAVDASAAALHAALRGAGTPFHAETLGIAPPWREDEETWMAALPVAALERVLEVMG